MRKTMVRLLFFMIVMILCSCTAKQGVSDNKLSSDGLSKISKNEQINLPDGFTIDNIKSAFAEYINYRLWFYPKSIQDSTSDKMFDAYVDKSIDVELRLYDDSSSVYAFTNIGKWLAVFKTVDGIVYCDGQASVNETAWPNTDDYAVVEQYSLIIQKPYKPNYGTSTRKDKMIESLESAVKIACKDYYSGQYDEWINVDAYIVDFYEFEKGAHCWLIQQNGSITEFPVVFEEVNNEIKVTVVKGYTINGKSDFNEFGRYQFEKEISDAIDHFKCNPK